MSRETSQEPSRILTKYSLISYFIFLKMTTLWLLYDYLFLVSKWEKLIIIEITLGRWQDDYFLIYIYIVYNNNSTERRVFPVLPYSRNQYSKMIFPPPKVVILSFMFSFFSTFISFSHHNFWHSHISFFIFSKVRVFKHGVFLRTLEIILWGF